MASIPADATILTLEEALSYFPQWSPADRRLARAWVEKTGVDQFYVPASGGYVAGHGGPNRSVYLDIPVNGLVMHAGFLHAWPNEADIDGDKRIELSNSRGSFTRTSGSTTASGEVATRTCPSCYIVSPRQARECDSCGYDFAASECGWTRAGA